MGLLEEFGPDSYVEVNRAMTERVSDRTAGVLPMACRLRP